MLAVAAALLLLPGLGATDLWAPDEPRYAQIAEELRAGDEAGWLLPHLIGAVYTQKPPLYFWLAALAGVPEGHVSEGAARLPSALAGIACVWLVARFGARLLGPRRGLLAGALLLTSFEFARLARRAQLDVVLTLFELVALAAFWRIRSGASRGRASVALLHAALGLAVLTKGPVGLLVPALVIAASLAWERRFDVLRRIAPPWAFLLSVLPGLAWLAGAAWLAPPGYIDAAVGENLFARFFAGSSHARPFYYYLYQLPLDFLPWTLLWPLVVERARAQRAARDVDPGRRDAWRFLICWVAVPLVFFSLSGGKRGLYLLPSFPALALLCADAVVGALDDRSRWTHWVAGGVGALLLGVALAGALAPRLAAPYGVVIPAWVAWTPAAICALAGAAWLASGRRRRSRPLRVGVALATVLCLEGWVFGALFPRLDSEKSLRPVAVAAAARVAEGRPVGLLAKPTLRGGLAYYAKRPVVLLDDADAVARFVASGGRAIVAPTRRLDRLGGQTPLRVVARFRQGRRELLLLEPAP